jgi:putative transposase
LTVNEGVESYRIASPQFFKRSLNEVRCLNRAWSGKVKGSNHDKKAKRALAKVPQTIANNRLDWFFSWLMN